MAADSSGSPLPSYTDAVPYGHTARRLQWAHLPPDLREEIERRCGSPVAEAHSQDSGFTPGFASVLVGEDGGRTFVKAASVKAQRQIAESYREEARKLAALPATMPAPRLRWTTADDAWVVLGIEDQPGTLPRRPWQEDDVAAVLDTLETVADGLAPPPDGLSLPTFLEEFGGHVRDWDHLRATRPGMAHLDDAAALARRLPEATGAAGDGVTVVHTDVRADNLLVTDAGQVRICDWNWLVTGPAWLDSVFFLLEPYGDGMEVDEILAQRRLLHDVPAESIDIVLAMLVGFFVRAADQAVPPTSPHLREHQRWMGDVTWGWLCDRRGWACHRPSSTRAHERRLPSGRRLRRCRSRGGQRPAACLLMADLRFAAWFLWMTPAEAALSSLRPATRASSCALSLSPEDTASRNWRTAVFSADFTDLLRSCAASFCRLRLIWDLMFATGQASVSG